MSCFLMNNETISQIADFTASVMNNGFDYFGFSGNDFLRIALRDCKRAGFYNEKEIYNLLYIENIKAVNGRYKDHSVSDFPEYKKLPPVYWPQEWNCEQQRANIKLWHFELLKKIDCYLYQCDEDVTAGSVLLSGMKELRSSLSDYVLFNNEFYKSAAWG